MNGKAVVALLLLASVGMALPFLFTGCAERPVPVPLTAQNLLERSKGQVLVLLMGMEGCPNTRRGTETLAEYAAQRPAGVTVVRVDAPPPAEELAPVPEWKQPYAYVFDAGREVADRLEFFFYPTLYVLDRDGTVRYSGGLDLEDLQRMVSEIVAEQPGAKKKIYTPPLPAVGTPGADFRAKTLDGKDAGLASLRGPKGAFLYFASTACPFSVRGLPAVAQLAKSFGEKGVGFTVINKQEAVEDVRRVCAENAPELPVVVDTDAAICKAYGVEPVPFFFILDGKGAIAERRPFTPESATAALNQLLGLASKAGKATGAG